jgi:hypothetical protein
MAKFRRTRGLLMIGMAIAILCQPVSSLAETLVWDASSGQVDGYKIHWGTRKSSQPNTRDVGNKTRYDLNKLPLSEGATYYLSVSAYNQAGESPPCEPVVFTPGDNTPPAPPVGLSAD